VSSVVSLFGCCEAGESNTTIHATTAINAATPIRIMATLRKG